MIALSKVKQRLEEIEVHKTLGTPHSWVLIPNCNVQGNKRIVDMRICSVCFYGEWKDLWATNGRYIPVLEGYDCEEILRRWRKYEYTGI